MASNGRAGLRAFARCGEQGFAAHAAHLIQAGQSGQLAPGFFVDFGIGQQARDRMGFAGGGQRRMHRTARLVATFAVELDGQHFAQGAVAVAAAIERARAAEHGQSAAVTNEVAYPLQVHRIEIGAVRKVIEKDHVEVFQLLEKNIVDRKGDQAQLVFRHIDGVGGRAQENERHQLDQWILFHRHAQKTVVPRRRSGQGQNADLVALHLDFKLFLIVLGDLLARLRRHAYGERMGTQFFRREAECHFLLEGIGVDGDGAGGDEIFPAVEKQRHGFALHAESLQGQVDFEFTAAKGEFRRAELGDAHVGKAFGFADADGENRRGDGGRHREISFRRW